MKIVPNRKKNTLREALILRVKAGTTIYSDQWAGYGDLTEICMESHETVNHQRNFVNPDNNDVHTQNIENNWRNLKLMLRKREHI